MTASSMPTGLIWKVCFHSRGSFGEIIFNQLINLVFQQHVTITLGHLTTSILAVNWTLLPTLSPEHLLVCRIGPSPTQLE